MPVKTYSSGMYMRLAFAIASHVSPDMLLLDEVLAVGDAAFQRKCFGRIFDFRRGGGTLLFVSHDPGAVEMVCDRVVLLRDGGVVADGPPTEVMAVYHRGLAAASGAPAAVESERAEGEIDDDPRTWGTREVVIRACALVGPDGPTARFMSGDPFRVELEVGAPRPVATPNFGIAVHSVEGALCYGTNTRLDALDIPEIAGVARVAFEVPALALHEGEFTVTLGVVSHDYDTVYHWLDRWLEFTVFQRSPGQGIVEMAGTWRLEAGAGAGRQEEAGSALRST